MSTVLWWIGEGKDEGSSRLSSVQVVKVGVDMRRKLLREVGVTVVISSVLRNKEW